MTTDNVGDGQLRQRIETALSWLEDHRSNLLDEGTDLASFRALGIGEAIDLVQTALAAAERLPKETRCKAVFITSWGERRCDRQWMHEGPHIRNDGCGRPEYMWDLNGQVLR